MSSLINCPVFNNWAEMLAARGSEFFKGHTSDWVGMRKENPHLIPSIEPLFTQSNARVLLGHAANGSLRFVSLPTALYTAPTQTSEFGLGPGMYHHFDVTMYAGDLSYKILLDDPDHEIDLSGNGRDNVSYYADYFLPMTEARHDGLEIALISLAPVAPDESKAALAPAPLPGPPGALYVLYIKNTSSQPVRGKIVLHAGDLLVGHYDDAKPELRVFKKPVVDLHQQTLILTRPVGSVGVHLHDGIWTQLDVPFQAERAFEIVPGEELAVETHIALGKDFSAVMEAIYALHLHSALDWVNYTARFWRSRLGNLLVDTQNDGELTRLSQEIYIRSLLDNFNCLQTDAEGNLIAHWQGAPSHGYGTVWGIDIEPTAVSIVHICPELALRTMLFFLKRSRVPKGPPDHSVPILVAPIIIARKWLQATGDKSYFIENPQVMEGLLSIIDHLLTLKKPEETLFPSRYSSDGAVGRRYDYGTNVKVWYTFDSIAYIYRSLADLDATRRFTKIADAIQDSIQRTMIEEGPFGPQISGGTNLGEDPGSFYLPEGIPYYDGEDTSSMLAPIYGICDFTDSTWINYHRFARSIWCPNYDQEFGALRWSPGEFGAGALDGTAFFSRLGGSVTPAEMVEALKNLRQNCLDDVTGSVFWWPYGREYRRSLTRCSQGQGAWAWQYLQQWLGLSVDAIEQRLILAPRGLLTQFYWEGFQTGSGIFDIVWSEAETGTTARIKNRSKETWMLEIGFRQPNAGALGELIWRQHTLEPGGEKVFFQPAESIWQGNGLEDPCMTLLEADAFGDSQDVIFKRYGPALLWGHWDFSKLWDMQAMPWALRFLVVNATGSDWSDLVVELTCPDGWHAQGREPCHWMPPDQLQPGAVRLTLGTLPSSGRTTAAFWIEAKQKYEYVDPREASKMPFHGVSQPGAGITVYARNIAEQQAYAFTARLSASSAKGGGIESILEVPVKIIPYIRQ
jgi:hypothetical protein